MIISIFPHKDLTCCRKFCLPWKIPTKLIFTKHLPAILNSMMKSSDNAQNITKIARYYYVIFCIKPMSNALKYTMHQRIIRTSQHNKSVFSVQFVVFRCFFFTITTCGRKCLLDIWKLGEMFKNFVIFDENENKPTKTNRITRFMCAILIVDERFK